VLEYNCFGLVKEVRTEQVRMATDIELLLLKDEGTLLAEGGTGLGKSYAYTVPALAHIIELANTSGKSTEMFRTVIATAKKTLQSQLFSDLPKLCETLGVPSSVKVVLYKGLNNYACWKLAASVPEHERVAFNAFIETASKEGHPADITDWPGARPMWWDAVNLENCPLGVGCEHYRDCRPRVKDANIIITNQHLLGLDLSLFQPGWLFGPYNLLVVDEAHHLAKALRDLLSSTLRPEAVAKASKHLLGDPRLQDLILEIGGGRLSASLLGNGIDSAYKSLLGLTQITANAADLTHRYRAQDFLPQFEDCHRLLDSALTSLIPIHDELVKNHGIVKSLGVHDDHDAGYYLAMLNRFNRVTKPLISAKTFLEKHIDPETVQQYITVSSVAADDVSLYMTPINIGPIMGPILEQLKHKVFVSATLSLSGDFTYFKDDLGLNNAEGHVYGSPFDIARNVALYLPPWDMPQPAHGFSPERLLWISRISEEIRQLCNLTKGGVFVLFSATKDMDEVENHIGPVLRADGLELIVQRGEVTQHINSFRQIPNGVLFGLKSVWEGIDIVGDQLRCVIIPKLPFPNPNDPVIASRSELATAQGDNAFARVSLPAMFTDMRQGTGRLIRSATDKGIIAILDIRAWTGGSKDHDKRLKRVIADPDHKRLGYGKDLLDILGFTTLTNDFTRLGRWYMKTFTALNTVNTVKEGDPQNGTSERE
jgi:ATP-dependent DNA helicase DinG